MTQEEEPIETRKTLNETVDKIYCINLDRRQDRWQETTELFKRMSIEATRVSAIDMPEDPGRGLRETIIGIFRDAIQEGHERILIFEDDVEMEPDYFYEGFWSCWNSLPEDWDMFYFSAMHQYWPIHINENLFKLKWSTAAHAIIFRKQAFETILAELEQGTVISDVIYARLQHRLNAYCCIEPIAWQRKGFSDIEGKEKWYAYLKDIDFYNRYTAGLVDLDDNPITKTDDQETRGEQE